MALQREKIRTNRTVRDNRRKPKMRPDTAPRGKSKVKQSGTQMMRSRSRAKQLQHQQDRIDAGYDLDPGLAQPPAPEQVAPRTRPAPVLEQVDSSPVSPVGAGMPPPMPPASPPWTPPPMPPASQPASQPQGPSDQWTIDASSLAPGELARIPGITPDSLATRAKYAAHPSTNAWIMSDGTVMPLADHPLPTTGPPPANPYHERFMRTTGPPAEPPPTPMADYLLNTPPEDRPPTQPGWDPRYASLRRTPETYTPTTPPTARLGSYGAKSLNEVQRAEQARQIQANMSENGLPTPQTNTPMTTQTARVGSTVNAMPRPVTAVERELQGTPNFDHAAGPQNEEWQQAVEAREAARDERMGQVRANARQEAGQRRRRLAQREAMPRPQTNMMGALWNRDPALAAKVGMQRRGQNITARNQAQQMRLDQQKFRVNKEMQRLQGEQLQAETSLTEAAMDEVRMLGEDIKEQEELLIEARERGASPSQIGRIEDDIERMRSERRSLLQQGGGTPGRPRTVDDTKPGYEPEDLESSDVESWDYRRQNQPTPFTTAVGDISTDDPFDVASRAARWRRSSPNVAVATDAEIEALLPKLRSAPRSRLGHTGIEDAEAQAMINAAHPMSKDEAVTEARARVKALMDFFGKTPSDRAGSMPVVNGYRLKKKELTRRDPRPAAGFGGYRTPNRPVTTYAYSWVKVK